MSLNVSGKTTILARAGSSPQGGLLDARACAAVYFCAEPDSCCSLSLAASNWLRLAATSVTS
ncbi:hypothetical protein ALQ71_200176 [Pseudomonas coronafaciens pv. striafaciens]|nr:hypothetical protein ALQ71_200176 [Pseudomonas coronafaciens pv. striafaciens]